MLTNSKAIMFFENLFKKSSSSETNFTSHGLLTIGVEVEFQLIDKDTLYLRPAFPDLFKACKSAKLKEEFYLSSAEVTTDKHINVNEIDQDLSKSFQEISEAARSVNIALSTTGCHPFSRYNDCIITPSPRYNELMDRNCWLTKRMAVYGLHIHLGMKSGDDAIRFNNFFLHFLPHLLALSASSPFWQETNTGLAACRPTTYESLPTAGQPYIVNSWKEFENLYMTLKKCQAINCMKDLWWDLRPSPTYGTLEIRICDGAATLAEASAIAAYIHLLAHWFNDNGSWLESMQPPLHWLSRENKWRVIRYGLEAELVKNLEGTTKPINQDIMEWLDKTSDYAEKLKYQKFVEIIKDILKKGNSSSRQIKVYNQTQSVRKVVEFNIAEFLNKKPLWEEA